MKSYRLLKEKLISQIKIPMKKIFIITLLFPFFCISQDFNAGIISGFSTSQVSGDQLSGFNKVGPRIGFFVNRNINWYTLQLELQYISKGSKKIINTSQSPYLDNAYTSYINDYRFHLDYIGIPISIHSNITKKITLETGNSINILIRQKEEIDFYIDNSREVNKLEYCYFIGLFWDINNQYSINIRLSNSILPIRKHSSGQTYRWNRGQYNTTLSFTLFYYI